MICAPPGTARDGCKGGCPEQRWRDRFDARLQRKTRAVRPPTVRASALRRGTSEACPCQPRAACPDGQLLPASHVQQVR